MGALTIMAMRATPEDGTRAPTSAADCRDTAGRIVALPVGLQRYLPRHRYFLLDEGNELAPA